MDRTLAALSPQVREALAKASASPFFWCLLATSFIMIRSLAGENSILGPEFDDTDDALRLVHVRDLLINGNWFDRTLAQIGAPEALQSHWSRLIDLPIALLISLFSVLVSYPAAETAAQIVWPSILLLTLIVVSMHEVRRRAGLFAAGVLVALFVASPSAVVQFLPGRIDHHNTQILLTVAGALMLQRAFGEARIGWIAGALFGGSLLVGLEALPLIAALMGTAALFACWCHEARAGVTRAIIACAATALAGHLITTAPGAWFEVACDALSLNLLALIGSGAVAAFVLQQRFDTAPALVWLGGFAAAGMVGLAGYAAADPVCLGGAFARVDKAVIPIWLQHVNEGRSLLDMFAIKPSMVIAYVVTVGIAVTAAALAWRASRTPAALFIAATTALAALYGFYYVKLMPYGIGLALPVIACWIATLPALGETPARTVRIGAVVLLSEACLMLFASALVMPFSSVETKAEARMAPAIAGCRHRADMAALDRLKPGLVFSNVDLGPFIIASSRHRVVAGPYHRLDKSIIATHSIMTATPAEAEAKLRALGADYVVVCVKKPADDATPGNTEASETKPADFADHLQGGHALSFLAPVSIGKTAGPIRVWRVR